MKDWMDGWAQWNSNLSLTVNGSGKFELWNTTTSIGNLSGDGTNPNHLNDASGVTIASGAALDLTFSGIDTIGSLEINGSGLLPPGLYNSSHPPGQSGFAGQFRRISRLSPDAPFFMSGFRAGIRS